MHAHKQVARDIRSGNGSVGRRPVKKGRRQSSTRLENAPSPALMGMPHIPAGIPHQLVHPVSTTKSAKIALALLDAGLLNETDIIDGNRHPASLISSAFKRWYAEKSSPLQSYCMDLVLSDSANSLIASADEGDCLLEKGIDENNSVFVAASYGKWDKYYLKERITALEVEVPGLGNAAYDRLSKVVIQSGFNLTPEFLIDHVRYSSWQGYDNETEFIDDCYDDLNDEEREEILSEMFVWDDVKELTPHFTSTKLAKEQLEELSSHSNPSVSAVAKLLLEDVGNFTHWFSDRLFDDGTSCSEPSIWLQWDDDNVSSRIVDDWYHYACEVGATDLNVFWLAEISAEGIIDLFERLNSYITSLRWVERMLNLVGSKVE